MNRELSVNIFISSNSYKEFPVNTFISGKNFIRSFFQMEEEFGFHYFQIKRASINSFSGQ